MTKSSFPSIKNQFQDRPVTRKNGRRMYLLLANLAFALTLAVLVGLGRYWHRTNVRFNEASRRENHTYEVLLQLDKLLESFRDADANLRKFIFIGDKRTLEPYNEAVRQIDQGFAQVRSLTQDNPRQQKRFDALEPVIREKLGELAETTQLRMTRGFDAALRALEVGFGKGLVDRIVTQISDARAEELLLLKERVWAKHAEAQAVFGIVVSGGAISFTLLLTAFLLFRRGQASLHASEVRYRRLFEAARDGVLVIDPHTRKITDANPFMTELLTYARSELVGKELWEIGLLKDAEANQAAFRELEREGYIRYEDLPLLSSKGEHRDVEFVSNLYDQNGQSVIQCNIRDITERKAIEERQRRQAELLDLSQDAIFARKPDGTIFFWNRGAEQLYGYTKEQAKGEISHELLRTVFPRPREEIEEISLREGFWQGELLHTTRSGAQVCVSSRWSYKQDENGRHLYLLESNTDITETKAIQERLRESEERFRTMANSIPQLAWIARADGHIVWYNQRWYEYTGTTPEQMEGWGWQSVHDPKVLPKVMERWLESINAGQPLDMEFPLRGADGRFRAFLTRVLPIKDAQGNVLQWFGTNTDITERQAMEERLRQLSRAVDQSPTSIVITDTKGHIEYVNPKFTELTGYSFEEAIGKNPRFLKSGENPPSVYKELWETITAGHEWHGEFRNRKKNGELFWESASICPVLDENASITHFLAVKEDITDRKLAELALLQAQEAAQQASQAKDTFISSLSHELRTPLTPILLTASALESDPSLDTEARSQISLVRRNIEIEARLIDDLLDVSKIARGKISLQPQEVDIGEILLKSVEVVKGDMDAKRITVHVATNAKCSRASVDPVRIQQVFWNLLKNASKFTPLDGDVFVRTCNPDPHTLCVEVRDTGMGIATENLEKIFVPFEQGAATGDHRFGGLGLGLPISKAIIGLHDGSFEVSSAGLNQGATFTVCLPACRPALAAPAPAVPPPTPVSGPAISLHILLVEDDENTRTVICRLLNRDGHHVEAVGTFREAMRTVEAVKTGRTEAFHVLISDLGLPDGSGLNVAREIKAHSPGIKAVAVSGYGTEEDLRNSMEAGFNTHLTKPISIEEIRRALAA